ncbi:NADH dehydrogenase [Trypanosoma conorhini]|uniref:NADH dehydrogenase [ubiquinone] 1 beta subcomplex subunit 7 n=1 Tax=Trypanosoma conorhini TaxID=83891 RepID=A0A3R7LNG2_9TRYP|nr:NADH dehydrogenase [Trypanosoma conorhini]RNF00351.1 NADH dehydrogenase [Trypanosoma conorhini]
MTEYLKDLGRTGPGDPMPPINLGPYDNPLLWNMLDPFGADRGHQRRPMSVSRNFMELHNVPIVFRDQCVHRWVPFHRCIKNLKPVTWGTTNCHEFEEAWMVCRAYETYRSQLLKSKFMELTKDYTAEDKKFFPSLLYLGVPTYMNSFYWTMAASQRLSGWDEKDPANPIMWHEPNRALMRSEFSPTNWERGTMTNATGHKLIPDEIVHDMVPGFPLPEDKRPETLV